MVSEGRLLCCKQNGRWLVLASFFCFDEEWFLQKKMKRLFGFRRVSFVGNGLKGVKTKMNNTEAFYIQPESRRR
jgi:hypothetical protein